jgi:acetolactate decarboxylase
VHIVNLPKGTQVHSPEEAHRGQVTYPVTSEACDMVGFFSREHQGIFTHHDSYVHVHLLTQDKKKMGHVDEMIMQKGSAKLYIPK